MVFYAMPCLFYEIRGSFWISSNESWFKVYFISINKTKSACLCFLSAYGSFSIWVLRVCWILLPFYCAFTLNNVLSRFWIDSLNQCIGLFQYPAWPLILLKSKTLISFSGFAVTSVVLDTHRRTGHLWMGHGWSLCCHCIIILVFLYCVLHVR